MKYILDRFEGEFAIFVGEDKSEINLQANDYSDYSEGDLFLLCNEKLVFSREETTKRKNCLKKRFYNLIKRNNK